MTSEIYDRIRAGDTVINGWLSIPNAFSAEIMLAADYDTLTIDMQHGLMDFSGALAMTQAITRGGRPILIRASSLDSTDPWRLLDIGIGGVICPMIETAEDAERLVAACSYPPRGHRSIGPIRANLVHGIDFPTRIKDEDVVLFAMIETAKGVENAAEIAAVDGIAGTYIGPVDLALSMNRPAMMDNDDEQIRAAIRHVARQTADQGKIRGIHCSSVAYGQQMREEGFQFLSIGSDHRLLGNASRQLVEDAHVTFGRSERASA